MFISYILYTLLMKKQNNVNIIDKLSKKQVFFIIFGLLVILGSIAENTNIVFLFIRVLILSIMYWGVFEFMRYMYKQLK